MTKFLMGHAKVNVRCEAFQFCDSTAAKIGADCYLADDETVIKADGAGARSNADVARAIKCGKVWIEH